MPAAMLDMKSTHRYLGDITVILDTLQAGLTVSKYSKERIVQDDGISVQYEFNHTCLPYCQNFDDFCFLS